MGIIGAPSDFPYHNFYGAGYNIGRVTTIKCLGTYSADLSQLICILLFSQECQVFMVVDRSHSSNISRETMLNTCVIKTIGREIRGKWAAISQAAIYGRLNSEYDIKLEVN